MIKLNFIRFRIYAIGIYYGEMVHIAPSISYVHTKYDLLKFRLVYTNKKEEEECAERGGILHIYINLDIFARIAFGFRCFAFYCIQIFDFTAINRSR